MEHGSIEDEAWRERAGRRVVRVKVIRELKERKDKSREEREIRKRLGWEKGERGEEGPATSTLALQRGSTLEYSYGPRYSRYQGHQSTHPSITSSGSWTHTCYATSSVYLNPSPLPIPFHAPKPTKHLSPPPERFSNKRPRKGILLEPLPSPCLLHLQTQPPFRFLHPHSSNPSTSTSHSPYRKPTTALVNKAARFGPEKPHMPSMRSW